MPVSMRAALLAFQQDFASRPPGAVLDGRDIGTVVFPQAEKKFYLDADCVTRVERRYKEMLGLGKKITLENKVIFGWGQGET